VTEPRANGLEPAAPLGSPSSARACRAVPSLKSLSLLPAVGKLAGTCEGRQEPGALGQGFASFRTLGSALSYSGSWRVLCSVSLGDRYSEWLVLNYLSSVQWTFYSVTRRMCNFYLGFNAFL